jgi:hypothetical protein
MYADDLNYWQTSKSSPDVWIDRAKKQIEELGGKIEGEGFGMNGEGRAAFMIGFSIKGDAFKIIWPVMKSYKENERAARVQAATMLYHYVKGVALRAVVCGPRDAFFSHLMLPDGRVASQVAGDEILGLADLFPKQIQITHRSGKEIK